MAETKVDTARAETRLLTFLLDRLPMRERLDYSRHFRQMAAGEPAERLYIAELIEGSRSPSGGGAA